MDLKELKSFCVSARLRSISKAAEALQIGQPKVTRHIKAPERGLGTTLFDRVRRPIQLTLAGEKLASLATAVVEGVETLAERTVLAEEEGPVTLAATHEMIPHSLLPVVRAFRGMYSKVRLRIRSGSRVEVLGMVLEGEVELGLVPGHGKEPDLDFQGLFAYERVLITPLGHPLLGESLLSLEQIARWPLILMGPGTYTRTLVETEFRRRGLAYDVVMELDSMDSIKRYVAMGMGISIGPRLAIELEDERALGSVSLAHLLPVEQAGVVTLRGKTLSTPARDFISVMKRTLAGPAGRASPPGA